MQFSQAVYRQFFKQLNVKKQINDKKGSLRDINFFVNFATFQKHQSIVLTLGISDAVVGAGSVCRLLHLQCISGILQCDAIRSEQFLWYCFLEGA